MSIDTKDTNPKDVIGSSKLSFHVVPSTALAYLALGCMEGNLKYGKYNYRVAGVRVSIYLDALWRHYAKYLDGEWADPDSEVPHLASMMACCAIILDAHENGVLTDDRPPSSPATAALIDSMPERIAHLRELFKDYKPYNYTIADTRSSDDQELGDKRLAIKRCKCGYMMDPGVPTYYCYVTGERCEETESRPNEDMIRCNGCLRFVRTDEPYPCGCFDQPDEAA